MKPEDYEDFEAVIRPLFEYYDRPATPAVVKMYFAGLVQFEIVQIRRAIPQLLQTCEFMPKVANFAGLLNGSGDERAEKAFSLFADAVRVGGYMRSLYCVDACLVQAVRRTFGSWSKACEELPPTSDPMFANLRKTFVTAYQTAMREGCTEHYLVGKSEAANISNGGLAAFMLKGQEAFKAPLLCIGNDSVKLQDADFDARTGRICDAEILALPGMQLDAPRELVANEMKKLTSALSM